MSEKRMPVPEPRVAAFEKMGFGLFMHYGLYSLLERGEKVMYFEKIPSAEYEALAKRFTAARFSGRELARLAKKAGMRYACLTARHHDGFSLFDTCGLNGYDTTHSAAGRDLVADFVEGCRAEGITPFLYHTTLDWHEASFQNDFPAYLEYLQASVELLCRNYGKIGGFWFDGNWSRPGEDWKEERLYRMIRSYQPEAVLINNSGMSARGRAGHPELDCVTFENGRPDPMDRSGMPKYLAAEMCETLNDYWGYAREDCNYKSSARLIESLCVCKRAGANYLLNIGPLGDGSVAPEQRTLVEKIGVWRSVTQAPLYGAAPCGVIGEDGRSFALQEEDGRLYFFIFGLCRADIDGKNGEMKNGIRVFHGLDRQVRTIRWTDCGETLDFTQDGDRLSLNCTGYPYGKSLAVRVAVAE